MWVWIIMLNLTKLSTRIGHLQLPTYIKQINAMTAFLNLLIKKIKIYIELSDDYKKNRFIVLLYKILYNLKQSANQ